jgi:hypothetical protein
MDRDGAKKKEATTKYLRAVFGLESAVKAAELPSNQHNHHAEQLVRASRELVDILIADLEREPRR